MSSDRRVLAVVALGAVALVGASYYLFFVRPERATERARSEAAATLLLTRMTGKVEVAGPDGVWRPAAPGTRLSVAERIRTDDSATAELRTADGSTVRLSPATVARVDELRLQLERLSLGGGMLEANVVDDPQRVFVVQVAKDGANARSRGGAFSASTNGAGTAAVAVARGEVILAARGREVVIRTGQMSTLSPGAPPSAPHSLPASLFLKVDWPRPLETRHQLSVVGQTTPGARVAVAGRYVHVDRKGHYRAELDLADGTHQLQIRAVDVAGHVVERQSPPILVDSHTSFTVQPPNWR